MIREKSHYTILPLESRNQELNPWNSAGSIPVSPNRNGSTREQVIPPEAGRTCKLIHMTGSKKYSPVGTKAQSRVGLDF